MIFPIMMFVGNIGYVAVAVIGGYLVTRGSIALGDVQAFIQYSRQFSMPITQLSSMANTIQLTIASAERVFELLDEAEEPADPVPATSGDRSEGPRRDRAHVVQLQTGDAADRRHVDRRAAGTDDRHRRPHRRRQDDARQPADALLRHQQRRDPRSTASTSAR